MKRIFHIFFTDPVYREKAGFAKNLICFASREKLYNAIIRYNYTDKIKSFKAILFSGSSENNMLLICVLLIFPVEKVSRGTYLVSRAIDIAPSNERVRIGHFPLITRRAIPSTRQQKKLHYVLQIDFAHITLQYHIV